ncbi:MAG: hypothetical protein UR94_C0009G0002 [Parcubacteria group bacterium GW2011_GWA2_36_10]|nr:MAG: hypothetical protein UR94_C0009G0002 [Parcubacteria group bacterium GW2011_GWA2_36_10]
MLKKISYFFLFFSLFALPLSSFAKEEIQDRQIKVAADQTINHNYYAAGQNIEIYGTINGDLFLVGENIIIDSANINGDVFVVAKNVDIKGNINGDVRAIVGEKLSIAANIEDNVSFAGKEFSLANTNTINGHLSVWADKVDLQGSLVGDLEGSMQGLVLNNTVGGSANLYLWQAQDATWQISDTAKINGDLNYHALQEKTLFKPEQVAGAINFTKINKNQSSKSPTDILWTMVLKFFSLLVAGMVALYFFRSFFHSAIARAKAKHWQLVLWGLLFLVAGPIALLLVAMTFIGLPLAIITLLLWLIMLYMAQVVSAWLLGWWLKHKFFSSKNWTDLSILAFGILVFIILSKIPVLGWLVLAYLYLVSFALLIKPVFAKK